MGSLRSNRTLTVVGLMLVLAVPAAAKPPTKAELRQFDDNHDGKLDAHERRTADQLRRLRHRYLLARYDANHNGRLDRAELAVMRAARQKRQRALLAKYDTNHDGKLDHAERVAMRAQRRVDRATTRFDGLLKRFDADKDGKLSWKEIRPKAPGRARWMKKRFVRTDTNRDGMVDRAEFAAAARRVNRASNK